MHGGGCTDGRRGYGFVAAPRQSSETEESGKGAPHEGGPTGIEESTGPSDRGDVAMVQGMAESFPSGAVVEEMHHG